MKKIVSGKDLQEKILESINILCGTVKETLGPKGNNILIDHSNFSPFITNDGVTIAKNIESDDEVIGTILEIIKEASIKTNDVVGDGTTTTLVLLESLYIQSLEYLKNGKSPIILKKELDKVLNIILKELETLKRKPSNVDLKNIALISANDEELGSLAYQVTKKVKSKEAIIIKDTSLNKCSISYLKGYSFDVTLASPYFLRESNILKYKNPYVLLMNTTFVSLESISFLLNDILANKQDLVIIANNFEENTVQELVSLTLTTNINICLLKIEDYGMHVYETLKDIECITGAKIVEFDNDITSKDIGIVDNIEITNDKITISFKATKKIKNYLENLIKQAKNMTNDLEKDFYEKRKAMFSNGTAEIKLGAPTKTEGIEKRMRLEDALCALSVANQGVVTGGGISLLQIADKLDSTNYACEIWKNALKNPLEQILKNAGLDYLDIEEKIKKENYKSIFNVALDKWENISETQVIDPYLVIHEALINAVSIAGMLITTTSLIINEYKNNKENEYANW